MAACTRQDLERSWTAIAPARGPWAAEIFDELLAMWSASSRHYHNVEHLQECLSELDAVASDLSGRDARTIALAIWFHDAIYDATRNDNEAASAELATARLGQLGASPDVIASVRRLILDTAHRDTPSTPEGRLMVDIDLSILGKPTARFDHYDAAIRAEYAHVPWPDYRIGRLKVLQSFLDRPAIYHTDRFTALYEDAARANLKRTIAKLKSVDPESPREESPDPQQR